MAAQIIPEFCPNCDREWPACLGWHNCNYTRKPVHKDAIVSDPGEPLPDIIKSLYSRMESQTCRSQQYYELGDPGGISPYRQSLNEIDASIGLLKRYRREIQQLAGHTHRWDDDDYCSICGADGRA
jgi:hypothetical protein